MARNKKPSLIHQVVERLKMMDCRGQSRHKAKKEYREKLEARGEKMVGNRVPGKIFSELTFKNYLDRCCNFVRWAQKEYGVRTLEEIERRHKEIVNKYIDYLETDKSPYTIHGYVSAISMLLGTKNGDYELPQKSYNDITKNRIDPDAQIEGFDNEKHADLVRFIKATGLRRIELCRIRPEQVVKNIWGDVCIYIMPNQAKGGRPRIVHPIKEDAEWVYQYAREQQRKGKKRIFSVKDGEIPKRAPCHPLRAVFAERKYTEALKTHATGEIYRRRGDKREFDKGALQVVSDNMGHNRLGICVQNYLWRNESED
ncbi:MAG: hypothetical protein WBK48_10685 [Dethiobacteria bacterium]|jgi:integrase